MGGWLLRVLFERGWGREVVGVFVLLGGRQGGLFWLLERSEE